MKLAYYPGCSGHGTSKEYEASTRSVCRALGLEFAEIEDWNCCGSTPAHAMDTVLSGALAARNFRQVARTGRRRRGDALPELSGQSQTGPSSHAGRLLQGKGGRSAGCSHR